jgi:hypothetical protein
MPYIHRDVIVTFVDTLLNDAHFGCSSVQGSRPKPTLLREGQDHAKKLNRSQFVLERQASRTSSVCLLHTFPFISYGKMTRLFRINAAILAISSVAFGFTSLTPSSSNRFAVRSPQPLHMSLSSSFDEWELPEELPERDETSLLEAPEKPGIDFLTGDDLQLLRQQVLQLRAELHDARATGDAFRILKLQRSILKAEHLDAEFVYKVSQERMEAAEAKGRWIEAEQYGVEAMKARQALPQFNLEGLWVGK